MYAYVYFVYVVYCVPYVDCVDDMCMYVNVSMQVCDICVQCKCMCECRLTVSMPA